MQDDKHRGVAAFEAWQDEEVERILALSPDELDTEMRAAGMDPAAEAEKVRAIIERALAASRASK